MNLLRHFFRRRYLSDTGLPVGDPETGSEDVRTRELLNDPWLLHLDHRMEGRRVTGCGQCDADTSAFEIHERLR